MPSPYVKKGYGEVSKRAEDRIRKDVIVKCKVCGGIMKYIDLKTLEPSYTFGSPRENYYHCSICLRNVVLTQL